MKQLGLQCNPFTPLKLFYSSLLNFLVTVALYINLWSNVKQKQRASKHHNVDAHLWILMPIQTFISYIRETGVQVGTFVFLFQALFLSIKYISCTSFVYQIYSSPSFFSVFYLFFSVLLDFAGCGMKRKLLTMHYIWDKND